MSSKSLDEPINDTLQRFRRLSSLGIIVPEFDIDQLSKTSFSENDLLILSNNLNGKAPWIEGRLSITHIVKVAYELEISVGAVLERFQKFKEFKLDLFISDQDQFADLMVDDYDLFLITGHGDCWNLKSWDNLWPVEHVPVGRIAYIAYVLSKPIGYVLRRLQKFAMLGLKLPIINPNQFDDLIVTDEDLVLLSDNYDEELSLSAVLWLDQEVPAVHIKKVAEDLNRPIEVILKRLQKFAPLGLKISQSITN